METTTSLPPRKQLGYAVGQLGWSILINVVSLELVYFYLPPDGSGISTRITQVAFLGVLNAITLIAASGRLLDAFIDPMVAAFSDRSRHRKGRRIPFMAAGAVPAAALLVLMFVPPVHQQSGWNILWLVVVQLLFYVAFSTYVTPYFALLPELGHTPNQRLNLSTWISITYALGIVIAAQTPTLADALQSALGLTDRVTAVQLAVAAMGLLAVVFMLVPVFSLDEKTYCTSEPSTVPPIEALRTTFANRNFVYYVVAAFSYFMGLTIITTGLLYYVTVLLGQAEALVGALLTAMVVVSFVFYPAVNLLAKKVGKKPLVVLSFLSMAAVFSGVFFLGRFPVDGALQAYLLVLLYSIPLAFLGVLPNAILADIAEHDALRSGQPKEAMFFAANTLSQKFGQTFGILVFAGLAVLGKDPGDDLGVRLSGVAGFVLCLVAGLVFLRYDERRVLAETAAMRSEAALHEVAAPVSSHNPA